MENNIRTKKFLFDYALKFLALPDAQVVTRFRKDGCPIPFDVLYWDKYVESLTGRKPCPICGRITSARAGALEIPREESARFGSWQHAFLDGGVCWRYPIHNSAWKMAHVPALTMGIEFEKALLMVLGPTCEPEKYLIECSTCMKDLVARTHNNNPDDLASYFERKVGEV